MPRTLRMLLQRDLKERKGITWSRQHIDRKIRDGEFPLPDGKTSDAPTAPNFWFEHTIDGWLKARAAKARKPIATATETPPGRVAVGAGIGSAQHGATENESAPGRHDTPSVRRRVSPQR
jgi:predicted DNA-binding transcriptional regulator AlpA